MATLPLLKSTSEPAQKPTRSLRALFAADDKTRSIWLDPPPSVVSHDDDSDDAATLSTGIVSVDPESKYHPRPIGTALSAPFVSEPPFSAGVAYSNMSPFARDAARLPPLSAPTATNQSNSNSRASVWSSANVPPPPQHQQQQAPHSMHSAIHHVSTHSSSSSINGDSNSLPPAPRRRSDFPSSYPVFEADAQTEELADMSSNLDNGANNLPPSGPASRRHSVAAFGHPRFGDQPATSPDHNQLAADLAADLDSLAFDNNNIDRTRPLAHTASYPYYEAHHNYVNNNRRPSVSSTATNVTNNNGTTRRSQQASQSQSSGTNASTPNNTSSSSSSGRRPSIASSMATIAHHIIQKRQVQHSPHPQQQPQQQMQPQNSPYQLPIPSLGSPVSSSFPQFFDQHHQVNNVNHLNSRGPPLSQPRYDLTTSIPPPIPQPQQFFPHPNLSPITQSPTPPPASFFPPNAALFQQNAFPMNQALGSHHPSHHQQPPSLHHPGMPPPMHHHQNHHPPQQHHQQTHHHHQQQQPYFSSPQATKTPLNDSDLKNVGKGIPMASVPPEAKLYFVQFKAGRTGLYYYLPKGSSSSAISSSASDSSSPPSSYDPHHQNNGVSTNNLNNNNGRIRPPEFFTGDYVIVEADRGNDLGQIILENISIQEYKNSLAECVPPLPPSTTSPSSSTTSTPLQQSHLQLQPAVAADPSASGSSSSNDTLDSHPVKEIYFKASPMDMMQLKNKNSDEKKALELVQAKVGQRNLAMHVTDVEWQFDRRRLTIYYYSDKYVDFNDLTKELYRLYKTRIWLERYSRPAPY